MSAIAGIYYLDNRTVDPADLGRMVDILAHRGPDGCNIWSEGSIGFGHRMLWTTPESLLETLPLVNESGDIAIVADARIDNREQLIAALNFSDRPVEKITDSQLILAAYEKWGENCPEQFVGDFAFAIWDGRKQLLFSARDHFGVKPFYYYYSGRTFIFATEIKGILCLSEVPRRLNEVRVGDYLTSTFDDTAITFYQEIVRLPPAHSMTVSHEGIRLQSYWSLDPYREVRLSSDEEYAEAFREIFTEAVRCRLRSAFPVGSLLSGGLDSSSITCMARKLLMQNGGEPLPTFSAIFDDVTECDERAFINAVLAQDGLEPHYVHGDKLSPLGELDRVLWHQDEAVFAFNLFLNWNLYGVAKGRGVRVLLDGFDGDTTVSHGVRYLDDLARAGRWGTLTTEVRGYARNFNLSPWTLLWSYWRYYGLDPIISRFQVFKLVQRIWLALKRRTLRAIYPSGNRPVWSYNLNPTFAQRIRLKERCQALLKDRSSPPQSQREDHYRTLTWGVMPNTLEALDRASAAFSIEPRFPFWDKRLVEFCLALPPEQKIHQGWTRVVMRRAMSDILPVEVQWRGGKSNLGPNFNHVLLTFGRERMEEVILQNPEAIEEYVDITALRAAHQRFVSGEASVDADAISIWKALSLALWLQRTDLTPAGYASIGGEENVKINLETNLAG